MTARPHDPYAVLGLPPTASRSEVARAVRRLLRRHHPDTRSADRRLPDGGGEPADVAAIRDVLAAYEQILQAQRSAGTGEPGRRRGPVETDRDGVPGGASGITDPGDEPPRRRAPSRRPLDDPPIRVTPVRWHSGPG